MPTTPLKSFLLVNIKSHFHLLNPYIKRELKTRRRRQRWVFFLFFFIIRSVIAPFRNQVDIGKRWKNEKSHSTTPLFNSQLEHFYILYICCVVRYMRMRILSRIEINVMENGNRKDSTFKYRNIAQWRKKRGEKIQKWKITRSDLILCCMKLFDSFHNLITFIRE
jgi:hypothetical protein